PKSNQPGNFLEPHFQTSELSGRGGCDSGSKRRLDL
ncbi:hypothetical protein L915_01986, partial [Phytophthora nicotianae]